MILGLNEKRLSWRDPCPAVGGQRVYRVQCEINIRINSIKNVEQQNYLFYFIFNKML